MSKTHWNPCMPEGNKKKFIVSFLLLIYFFFCVMLTFNACCKYSILCYSCLEVIDGISIDEYTVYVCLNDCAFMILWFYDSMIVWHIDCMTCWLYDYWSIVDYVLCILWDPPRWIPSHDWWTWQWVSSIWARSFPCPLVVLIVLW